MREPGVGTNRYAYAANDPINRSDANGHIFDTLLDIGFLIFDVATLVVDEVTNGGANRVENLVALGADAASTLIPMATGGGLAVRASMHADDVAKLAKTTEKAVETAGDAGKVVTKEAVGTAATNLGSAEDVAASTGPRLLPGEGAVGTFDDLIMAGTKGDNLTPHHIPSANRMAMEGVSKGDGIATNMEQPFPGVGGRHRATFTYGTQADINMTARDALAAGIWDARKIYKADGLYTSPVRAALQQMIEENKTTFPLLFKK